MDSAFLSFVQNGFLFRSCKMQIETVGPGLSGMDEECKSGRAVTAENGFKVL